MHAKSQEGIIYIPPDLLDYTKKQFPQKYLLTGYQNIQIIQKLLQYKTQLCNYYMRDQCQKGEKCEYAHGKEELRWDWMAPLNAQISAWIQGILGLPKYKIKLCSIKNECKNMNNYLIYHRQTMSTRTSM